MSEPLYTSDCRPARFRAMFASCPTHVRQIEAERILFCAWLRTQRQRQWLRGMVNLWPIAAGLVLGLMAPQLSALMARFEPWGMGLVFPFAVLAGRPELQTGNPLISNLPLLVLYAQFPLEGLVVRLLLGRRVTVPGVAGQVFYFHYLAGLQLLMIGGALTRALLLLR
jgi:hypothetical protein